MINIFYNRGGKIDFYTFAETAKKSKASKRPVIYQRVRSRPFFRNAIPDEVLLKTPHTLFLTFSISGIAFTGECLDLFDIDFSQLVQFINRKFRTYKAIKIIPIDVVAFDEVVDNDKLIDRIPEFVLRNVLAENTRRPVQLCHYHLLQPKYKTQYVDLYAWQFINHMQDINEGPEPNYIHFSYEAVDKKLNCLNNAARPHRSLITVLVKDFDISLTHRAPLPDLKSRLRPNNKHSILSVLFKDDNITKKFNDNYASAREQFSADDFWEWDQIRHDRLVDSFELIQKSFCHIVTEDPYFDVQPRISDKILKPLYLCRPFLLLGSCYTLSWMRQQGFRTFDKWWDESYDSCEDHQERFEAVYRIAEYINSLSLSDCKQILHEMKPVLEHNADHLNTFKKTTYSNLLL